MGGLNKMRAAICDMLTVARLLNLTLVVTELDKQSFWADPSNFEDIFDLRHFIDSLRDKVQIVKRLPKRFNTRYGFQPLEMPPVSWSNEKYNLEQVPFQFRGAEIHSSDYSSWTKIGSYSSRKGSFVALHLRYEIDMLAFSGCTQGCSQEEAEELKQLR
ncbi:hypothetical protein LguiA_033957 [Lonicera macranthoides]